MIDPRFSMTQLTMECYLRSNITSLCMQLLVPGYTQASQPWSHIRKIYGYTFIPALIEHACAGQMANQPVPHKYTLAPSIDMQEWSSLAGQRWSHNNY